METDSHRQRTAVPGTNNLGKILTDRFLEQGEDASSLVILPLRRFVHSRDPHPSWNVRIGAGIEQKLYGLVCPEKTAQCKAVLPIFSSSKAFTSAPAEINICAAGNWPASTAHISGVREM